MIPELALYLGAWSHHFSNDAPNEQHNLVGIQVERVLVARYENSYGKESWAVGLRVLDTELSDRWSLHFAAGFVNGYEDGEKAVSTGTRPFIAPSLRYHVTENVKVELGVDFHAVGVSIRFEY